MGPSRAGKSTLCNTLLNKYEALESSAQESITEVVNEYSNEYLHIYDTPGLTITKSKKLGDTSKIALKCLKNILKKVDDSMDDIHVIFFVLKNKPNIENMLPILKFLDKENKKRIEDKRKKFLLFSLLMNQKIKNLKKKRMMNLKK
jgi:GTPase Era involved in 16S rRNA processing